MTFFVRIATVCDEGPVQAIAGWALWYAFMENWPTTLICLLLRFAAATLADHEFMVDDNALGLERSRLKVA